MIHPLTRILTAAVLAVGLVAARGAGAEEIEPCQIAVKGDSAVAKACQMGGVSQAKRIMKQMVRAARAKGVATECADCHQGVDAWALNKGATEKFRRLVELTK
jgi:hypothetical protein